MQAIESFGKRALAWLVLIALGLLALKVIFGFVVGLLVTFLVIAVVVVGLFWALRHL